MINNKYSNGAALFVAWLSTAAFFGAAFSGVWVESTLGDLDESIQVSAEAEVSAALILANGVRQGKYKEVMEFHESAVEDNMSMLLARNDGVSGLTDNQYCILKKVRKYWVEGCGKECFPEISDVLGGM